MPEMNDKLNELSRQLDENILAVKGTLELIDTSVEEDDLHGLLLKAIERMDRIQTISRDLLVALKNSLDKLGEMKQ